MSRARNLSNAGSNITTTGIYQKQLSADGQGIVVKGSYTGNPNIFEVAQVASDGYVYVRDALGNTAQLTGYPSGTSTLRGRVTMPEQPVWHYIGGTTLSSSSWVVTKPQTAILSHSSYSTSTGAFTAPISGRYFVGIWGLLYPNGSSTWTTGWFKNGTTVGHQVQGGPNSASHTHLSNSLVVYLAAGDYVDFRIYAGTDGMNAYGTQWNQFGYLIG